MEGGSEAEGEIYRQGCLQKKKSGALKSVKKRWYSLHTDAFVTFRSEECAKNKEDCQEILPLIDIQTVKKQHTSTSKFPFEIITRQKTHVFLTDSPYEQDQWVKAFHTAMKMRCFHTQKQQVVSKYTANGKDRRSSTGAKKTLSFIKRSTSHPPAENQHTVDCDPSETQYQGIPIGTMNPGDAACAVTMVAAEASSNGGGYQPTTDQAGQHDDDDADDDDVDGGGYGNHQSMIDENGDPGLSGPPNLASALKQTELDDDEVFAEHERDSESSDRDYPEEDEEEEEENNETSLPLPLPIPAPTGLSRSPKRIFEEEQIYDEPPRIDQAIEEDIYDVPARDDDTMASYSSAMMDLQKLLGDDINNDDDASENEYTPDETLKENGNGVYDDDDDDDDNDDDDNLETTLTEKGDDKSAMDELRNLLDNLDEL